MADTARFCWRCPVLADHALIMSTLEAWSVGPVALDALPPRLVTEAADTSFIVESADGDLAGFVFALVTQAEPATGYIHFVWVSPELRRQGLGRRMYERVYERLRRRGCTRVAAVASPGNRGSIQFHRRLGFEPVAAGHASSSPAPTDRADRTSDVDSIVLARHI
ncbi:MAG: GNAT family N-acetyltransferase [Candidatus Nanopelagicales bacterium]